ncbi:transposase [Patescibacteria group bacterium]
MPAKNTIKEYKENAYYHIYNRGVARQPIFLDKNDYQKFLSYLKLYLTPINLQRHALKVAPSRILKNFTETVDLLAYCLMPNHFHLLVYQFNDRSIADFMKSLSMKYSIYFNRKNNRTGPLYEDRYKAVEVTSENQFIYLTKYIHRNPLDILPSKTRLEGYKYSSYGNYLKKFSQSWVKTDDILEYFKTNSYQEFVEEAEDKDITVIKNIAIDID